MGLTQCFKSIEPHAEDIPLLNAPSKSTLRTYRMMMWPLKFLWRQQIFSYRNHLNFYMLNVTQTSRPAHSRDIREDVDTIDLSYRICAYLYPEQEAHNSLS